MSDSLYYPYGLNTQVGPKKKGGMHLIMALIVSAFYSVFVILCVAFPRTLTYEVFPPEFIE